MNEKRDRFDELTVHKRYSTMDYTGYAFSGNKGHDLLVTDSLGNRLKDALTEKFGLF
jgi:hypothetical protein